MCLQVWKQPQLRRRQWRPAGRSQLGARRDELVERRDLVDQGAEGGPVEQDVVNLTQQVTGRRLFGDGPVHLGQVQPYPHRDTRQRGRA